MSNLATLRDPIWHVSSGGEVSCKLLYYVYLLIEYIDSKQVSDEPELSMGPFCVTHPTPIHQLPSQPQSMAERHPRARAGRVDDDVRRRVVHGLG